MSFTHSRSETFTRTSAKKVAAKVAGDLNYMRALYGKPTSHQIIEFEAEVIELLAGGYLNKVDYGFRRDGNWVVALSYVADTSGNLAGSDAVGSLSPSADVSGASFYSMLWHTQEWFNLPSDERERIEVSLSVKREPGKEPGTAGGYWSQDKTYSADGGGVRRSTFRPNA